MRKRQKPYFLLVILALCGGIVGFMSWPVNTKAPNPQDAPATGNKDIDVPNKSQIASDVSKQMGGATPKPGVGASTPASTAVSNDPMVKNAKSQMPPEEFKKFEEKRLAAASKPVVLKNKVEIYAPQPSDSQTQPQWWTDNAPVSYTPKAPAPGQKVPPKPHGGVQPMGN